MKAFQTVYADSHKVRTLAPSVRMMALTATATEETNETIIDVLRMKDVYEVAESPNKSSLRSADAFPVVASLPPKNSVCEPERLNDFRDVRTFVFLLTNENAR